MLDAWTLAKVGVTTKDGKSVWTFGRVPRGFPFRPPQNDNPPPPMYA